MECYLDILYDEVMRPNKNSTSCVLCPNYLQFNELRAQYSTVPLFHSVILMHEFSRVACPFRLCFHKKNRGTSRAKTKKRTSEGGVG